MKKFFTILLLLLVGSAYAQTALAQIPFVQSRFFGMPQGIADTCQTCAPSTDGVLEYRLAYPTLEGITTATYTVQLRVSGGNPAAKDMTRLAFASVRLTYNISQIGDGFTQRVVDEGACTYEPDDSFIGKYDYTFNDTTVNSFTITASTPDQTTTASSLVMLSDTFQDFVEITCSIISRNAGIAISGTDITSNMIYVYASDALDETLITERRNIFPLAHNNFRYFDNPSYPLDYASYSNGMGLRITFPQPLSTTLTSSSFNSPIGQDLFNDVKHTAGDNVALVEFNQIPPASSFIVLGSDTNSLGSFMPALPSYDENAPRATGISVTDMRMSSLNAQSTWVIETNKPLDPTTVNADNICLTETPGICPETALTDPTIESVNYAMNTTEVTVVIEEDNPGQSKTLTLAFKRNSVRGTDQRAMEEYQVELINNPVDLPDIVKPEISVEAVTDATGNTPLSGNLSPTAEGNNEYEYEIFFKVTANENVPTLNSTSSYSLLSVTGSAAPANVADATLEITPTSGAQEAILQYTVPVSSALAAVDYFTVARRGESLKDETGNDPTDSEDPPNDIAADGIITDAATARATRDKTPPEIWVPMASLTPSNDGKTYRIEFLVRSDEAVPSIGSAASYSLLHLVNSGTAEDLSSMTPLSILPDGATTMVTVIYTVIINDYTIVERTAGFTLGRGAGAEALRDADGNAPVKEVDGTPIPNPDNTNTGRIDDRPAAVASRGVDSPEIWVPSASLTPTSNDGKTYEIEFVVRSDEAVPTIGSADSYSLYRIIDGGADPVEFTGGTLSINANSATTMSTVTYTNVTINDYADVILTTGFTLYRSAVVEALRDADGNAPVKEADGTTPIANSARIDDRPAAVADREVVSPKITVPSASLTPSNDGKTYQIEFLVNSPDEPVPSIGSDSSYSLIRIISNGTTETVTGATLSVNANDDNTTATVTYTTTINDYADVRLTTGFTLYRSANEEALRDAVGNAPVMADGTTLINNSARIDDGDDAVADRDTASPVITVDEETLVIGLEDGTTATYSITFGLSVDSVDKEVSTLNDTSSYNLIQEKSDNTTETVSTQPTITVVDSMSVTISYAIMTRDLSSVAETTGFNLVRSNLETALLDTSGNLPTIGGSEINAGDTIARVVRDPDGPEITISVIDLVPEDDAVEAMPLDDGNSYQVAFKVVNTQHAEQPILNIGMQDQYRLLRKLEGIDTPVSTTHTATFLVDESFVNEGETTLTYTVRIDNPEDSLTDTQQTEGFVLARAAGGLLSNFLNAPKLDDGVADTTPVDNIAEDAPIDPDAVSRRDTTPPTIGVDGSVELTGENQYLISFEVTRSEAVRGFATGSTESFVLLVVESEGSTPTVSTIQPTPDTVTVVGNVATISYNQVTFSGPQFGFTLGRGGNNLRDLSNNDPVDHSTNTVTVLENAPLDSDEILRDITPAEITVVADGGMARAGGLSNLSVYQYSVTFNVTADKGVTNLANPDSYTIFRILNNGTPELIPSGMATITDPNSDANPDYTARSRAGQIQADVTFADLAAVQGTRGLTLGSGVNLNDDQLPKDGGDRTAVKDGGDPLYPSDASDTARVIAPLADGQIVAGSGNAIASRDDTAPELNVTAGVLTEASDSDHTYSGSFTVTVDSREQVVGIDTVAYQLQRVPLSNGGAGTPVDITATLTPSSITNNSVVISFSDVDLDDFAQAQDTYGFTLALPSPIPADSLIDLFGNDVNTIADTGDDAIARINKDSPVIGISTSDSDISGGTNGTYSMSFATTANQVVPTLNSADSYQLVQVMDSDDDADTLEAIAAGNITATPSGDTEATTISYTVDLSDLSGTQRANIEGFTLIRNGADTLIDRSGNQPAKADGTTLIAGTGADLLPRLISEVSSGGEISVVATIERTPPAITVLALGEEAVPSDDDVNEYTLRFEVESSEPVPDLDDPSSYVVMRRLISNGMLEPLATASVTPGDVDAGNQNTTLSFTVTLDLIDITRDTNGFTLGRAGVDADCHLCDASGNAPVKGGDDDHGSGAIAVDMRIDDAPEALLARDTTKPQITVAAGADGAVPQGAEGSGSYQMTFTVTSANDDAVPTLDMDSSYQLVRIFKNSTATEVITNLMVDVSDDASDTVTELTYTTTLTTQILDTAGFTLARSTDTISLLDASGNIPVKSDGTTITAGSFIASVNNDGQVDDENAIAELPLSNVDTLASLELTAMINSVSTNITLDPNPFDRDQLDYTASVIFSVDSVDVRPTANSDYVTSITVNSNDVESGDASNVVLNDPGTDVETEVEVKVTAEDGITSRTYTITITRATEASNVATLSDLTLEGIPSELFTFDPTTTTQAVPVPFRINQTTVMAMTTHPGATIAIALDGNPLPDPIRLAEGDNVITIDVMPEDRSTTNTYTITITRGAASNDATLSSLTLDGIPFTFNPSTTTYTLTVPFEISATTVTAVVNHPGASEAIRVGDSDSDGRNISLDVRSENVITIAVTPEDLSMPTTYTITITRLANTVATLGSLSLAGIQFDFDSSTFTYDDIVIGYITQTTVTAMVSVPGGAEITALTINGNAEDVTAAGSNIETVIQLGTTETMVEITVTAAAGNEQPYTLTITRNDDATLASLSLADIPFEFNSSTTTYTVMAGETTQTMLMATVSVPDGAMVTTLTVVNGTAEPITPSTSIETDIELNEDGDTVIGIEVTAADGSTQTYDITVQVSRGIRLRIKVFLEGPLQ